MPNNYIQDINNDITFEQAQITKSYLCKMITYYSNLETSEISDITSAILEKLEKEKAEKQLNELKVFFPELFLL
jgi:hypothetical protein